MLKKLAAISLTAGALILAAPTVASAAPSDSYPSPPSAKVGDAIIDTCEVSTVAFGAGFFEPSETVGVSVSGQNAGAAAISGNTAASGGSPTVTFRPPSDGQGSYALDFAGSRAYTATVTVSHGNAAAASCDHDPGSAAPAGTELPLTGGTELALTGGSVSPWIVGGAAVALVAGGGLVAVGAARRKRA